MSPSRAIHSSTSIGKTDYNSLVVLIMVSRQVARSSKAGTQKSAAWEALQSDLICENHIASLDVMENPRSTMHKLSLRRIRHMRFAFLFYYEAMATILLYG